MTDETKLKPCPWCGGKASDGAGPFTFFMWCTDCQTDGPHRNTYQAAVNAWNTRASDTEHDAVATALDEETRAQAAP